MAGSQQYKNLEIHFVLRALHMRMPSEWTRTMFEQRFNRKLTENQLRYLKNKYGRDPRFGTPAANSSSTFGSPNPRVGRDYWPTDDILQIDYAAFERRGHDLAEPNLRVVAPIFGVPAPNPRIQPAFQAPPPPTSQPAGQDRAALTATYIAHSNSFEAGQRPLQHGAGEGQPVGLAETPLSTLLPAPSFHNPSRHYNSYGWRRPPASGPGPGPSPFYTTKPVQNHGLHPTNHLTMHNVPQTNAGAGSNTSLASHNVLNDQSIDPINQTTANLELDYDWALDILLGIDLLDNGHHQGARNAFDGIDQYTATGPIHTCTQDTFTMSYLNPEPNSIGLNNPPPINTHIYTCGDRFPNQDTFGFTSNMATPASVFQHSNNSGSNGCGNDLLQTGHSSVDGFVWDHAIFQTLQEAQQGVSHKTKPPLHIEA